MEKANGLMPVPRKDSLLVNLYGGSSGLIHLLCGVGIEVGDRHRSANPFRSDVLQLRADNGEHGREQNAAVSPNKYEIANIGDGCGFGLLPAGSVIT